MPNVSGIFRASSTPANGCLRRSRPGDQIRHGRVRPLHRFGKPLHVSADCGDHPVRRMLRGVRFGGAHLGIGVDRAEPGVEEAAVVERSQAPRPVLREGSSGPVNMVEVVFNPDLGTRKLRREPSGRREPPSFLRGADRKRRRMTLPGGPTGTRPMSTFKDRTPTERVPFSVLPYQSKNGRTAAPFTVTHKSWRYRLTDPLPCGRRRTRTDPWRAWHSIP